SRTASPHYKCGALLESVDQLGAHSQNRTGTGGLRNRCTAIVLCGQWSRVRDSNPSGWCGRPRARLEQTPRGAPGGNRTLTSTVSGWCSTVELHARWSGRPESDRPGQTWQACFAPCGARREGRSRTRLLPGNAAALYPRGYRQGPAALVIDSSGHYGWVELAGLA